MGDVGKARKITGRLRARFEPGRARALGRRTKCGRHRGNPTRRNARQRVGRSHRRIARTPASQETRGCQGAARRAQCAAERNASIRAWRGVRVLDAQRARRGWLGGKTRAPAALGRAQGVANSAPIAAVEALARGTNGLRRAGSGETATPPLRRSAAHRPLGDLTPARRGARHRPLFRSRPRGIEVEYHDALGVGIPMSSSR